MKGLKCTALLFLLLLSFLNCEQDVSVESTIQDVSLSEEDSNLENIDTNKISSLNALSDANVKDSNPVGK